MMKSKSIVLLMHLVMEEVSSVSSVVHSFVRLQEKIKSMWIELLAHIFIQIT